MAGEPCVQVTLGVPEGQSPGDRRNTQSALLLRPGAQHMLNTCVVRQRRKMQREQGVNTAERKHALDACDSCQVFLSTRRRRTSSVTGSNGV